MWLSRGRGQGGGVVYYLVANETQAVSFFNQGLIWKKVLGGRGPPGCTRPQRHLPSIVLVMCSYSTDDERASLANLRLTIGCLLTGS